MAEMGFLEFLMLTLIVVIVLVGVIVVLVARYGLMKPPTENDIGIENLKKVFEEEKQVITDTKNVEIANLQKQNAVLTTQKQRTQEKLNKIQEEKEKEIEAEAGSVESLQQQYDVNPIKAASYVKQLGFNPDALSNPALSPLIWEKLNENKDLALVMGILVPKGTDLATLSQTSITEAAPEIAVDPIDQLFADLKEKGHIG